MFERTLDENITPQMQEAADVVGMRLFCLPWEGANTQVHLVFMFM